MGLHICYELRLPHTVADGRVVELLEKLRAYAVTRGVSNVTPLSAFHDAAPEADLQSPVFEDPDFEGLETEPLDPRHAPDNG